MLMVMGVSGSGKSTVAAQLAGQIGASYLDGDDFHPAANVAKMHAGTPLTDADRWPWLDRVAAAMMEEAAQGRAVVMACSALRRAYRDRLRTGTDGRLRFVFLDASFEVIDARLKARFNHFMPEALLRSQFDTLERPAGDEPDVVTVSTARPAPAILRDVLERCGLQTRLTRAERPDL